MTLDSLISRSRTKLAEQFFEEATFTRVHGDPVFNADTGEYEPTTTTVYEGPCKIRPQGTQGFDINVGEASLRLVSYEAKLPADTDVRVNDEAVCTASRWDAGLVDRRFRVTDVPGDSWQVGRVVVLEHIGNAGEDAS